MVNLIKQYVGRGPRHARTYLHEDVVTVVLRDTMTQAERTLVAEQRADAVKTLRRIFQGTFRDDAIELVEGLTGRRVMAFLSDHAVAPDVAVEVFVLAHDREPVGDLASGDNGDRANG